MVMRLLAVHCEVTTGAVVTDIIHRQKIKLCPDFIGYNGYKVTCRTL